MNLIYKKLRNKNKKLGDIKQLEDKIKGKEIVPNQEQLDKLKSKDQILKEMDEQQAILKIYQEAFPENPVWAKKGKKGQSEQPA